MGGSNSNEAVPDLDEESELDRREEAVPALLDEREADLRAEAETLLEFDTQNPPGRTADLISYLRESLASERVETEVLAADDEKPNLLVTVPGERPETLLYVGHVDTVPFDPAEWTYDPLGEWVEEEQSEGSGEQSEGPEEYLYGRGATDMKGAVAAMATVVRAFAETGTTPPLTLTFAFVSDEETGGDAGLDFLLESDALSADTAPSTDATPSTDTASSTDVTPSTDTARPADTALSADAAVVGETTCEGGRHSVAAADRGSVWLTLDASGVPAHGSRPALGVNAIDRLYRAVADVRETLLEYDLALDPELDSLLADSVAFYAPRMGETDARETFEYPTVNLGTLSGGEAVNTVPTSATAEVDVRVTATASTADVLAEVEAVVGGHKGVEIANVSRADGTYELPDSPLVSATAETAADVTGDRIYRRSATGGGDVKALRQRGVPTVEFGLGTDTAHATDEYTTATALRANAEVYARLPYALRERWAGTGRSAEDDQGGQKDHSTGANQSGESNRSGESDQSSMTNQSTGGDRRTD